jgi:hypothetical protein
MRSNVKCAAAAVLKQASTALHFYCMLHSCNLMCIPDDHSGFNSKLFVKLSASFCTAHRGITCYSK